MTSAWCFTGLWRNTLPHLDELLERMNETTIVDLCSGSGGPMPLVAEQLLHRFPGLEVTQTDLYPKPEAVRTRGPLRYDREPVDARAVPERLVGIRTMFSALHHFAPSEVHQMLTDAAEKAQPVAFFEFQRRVMWANLVPPTGLAQLAPWVLLWSSSLPWWRPVLTIFPLIPILYGWDSFVSILRTYSPAELLEMADAASVPGYRWEVREARSHGRERLTCLVGFPDPGGGVHFAPY